MHNIIIGIVKMASIGVKNCNDCIVVKSIDINEHNKLIQSRIDLRTKDIETDINSILDII